MFIKSGVLIQIKGQFWKIDPVKRVLRAYSSVHHRGHEMRKSLLVVVAALSVTAVDAHAQVPLSTYTDTDGYLDVQKLTCGQLAGTFQEDADLLVAWYSGWYNGLAKKHLANPDRAKKLEHEVIVYCKANPGIRVIDSIAVVFKDERMRLGIKMAK